MNMLPRSIAFDGLPLGIVDHRGEPWLTARELTRALGYRDESAVLRIYSRNQDEFTEQMTCTVELTVQVQDRETRIFSSRGCYAVGFFAKTDRAKAFRRWVLDVLEKHLRELSTPSAFDCSLLPYLALTRGRWGQRLTPNGYNAVSLNVAAVLDYLLSNYGDGDWHEISDREIGTAIGVERTSVRKFRLKLEDWGLIEWDGDAGSGTCSRIRVVR